jgi:protein disulfide-isomerase A6
MSIQTITKVHTQDSSLPHILLLTQKPKLPVLWKVLGWRHHKDISFGATKDEKGDIIKEFGIDSPADGKSKILIWAPGATTPTLYDGKCRPIYIQGKY